MSSATLSTSWQGVDLTDPSTSEIRIGIKTQRRRGEELTRLINLVSGSLP